MDVRLIIFLTSIAAVFGFLLLRPNWTVKTQLRQWADKNRILITKVERRYISQGPFTLRYKSGIVFKIEVKTSDGNTRAGWVRFAYDISRREKWSSIAMWDDSESQTA